jgi:voltage-gated potassium channel
MSAVKMIDKTIHQVKIALALLVSVVLFGTIGYMVIEGWNFIDALYMTIISITTTGYKEVNPLSNAGKIFTLFVIIFGVVTIAYIGGRLVQLLVETYVFRRRRMEKKIQQLKDHYIVCGFGRMGKKICEELSNYEVPFAVIEKNTEQIQNLQELDYLFIDGDATEDEVLLTAGVKDAKGLVAVLSTEAENVFTTLTARVLNPKIFIVSRAVEEENESKLLKAGANRVVKPYEIGGYRMTQVLLRPGVVDFIDIIARDRRIDLHIEEITVKPGSSLIGQKLSESPIRNKLNIIIVAITRTDDKVVYNPQSNVVIEENNKLIVIGEEKNIRELVKIAAGG